MKVQSILKSIHLKQKNIILILIKLLKALQTLNRDMPVGFVKGENSFYTITFYGEKDAIERLKQITVLPMLD